MTFNKQSVFNLALRGLSMGARFLLIFYLGKYFTSEDLGMYGLFFTTVTLGLFVLGLDFYTFTNREILYMKDEDKLYVLRNQLVFYGVTYAVFLLPMLLLFFYNVLPAEYIYLFYVILILEHLSQEFYRIFTVLSYPVFANWLLFLRSAAWIYVLLAYYFMTRGQTQSLYPLFYGWVIGAGLSVVLGFVKTIKLFGGGKLKPLELSWFITGLKVCSFYFLSTIALKVIEFANRYVIEYRCDLKLVGVFTFYSQVANMINVVIFTLFLMIVYPKLIIAVSEKNNAEYLRLKSYIMKKVLTYSIVLSVVMIAAIHPILYFMNKPEYFRELPAFYILIASNIFLNVSLVYHYSLYAFKKDVSLFISTAICGVLSMVLNLVLISYFGITGAAAALLLSYIALTITKAIYTKASETFFKASCAADN